MTVNRWEALILYIKRTEGEAKSKTTKTKTDSCKTSSASESWLASFSYCVTPQIPQNVTNQTTFHFV